MLLRTSGLSGGTKEQLYSVYEQNKCLFVTQKLFTISLGVNLKKEKKTVKYLFCDLL